MNPTPKKSFNNPENKTSDQSQVRQNYLEKFKGFKRTSFTTLLFGILFIISLIFNLYLLNNQQLPNSTFTNIDQTEPVPTKIASNNNDIKEDATGSINKASTECEPDGSFDKSKYKLISEGKRFWYIYNKNNDNNIQLDINFSSNFEDKRVVEDRTKDNKHYISQISCPEKIFQVRDEDKYIVNWENDYGYFDLENKFYSDLTTTPNIFPLNTSKSIETHPTKDISVLTTAWESPSSVEYVFDYSDIQGDKAVVFAKPTSKDIFVETYYSEDNKKINTFEWTDKGLVVRSLDAQFLYVSERPEVVKACDDSYDELDRDKQKALKETVRNSLLRETDYQYAWCSLCGIQYGSYCRTAKSMIEYTYEAGFLGWKQN